MQEIGIMPVITTAQLDIQFTPWLNIYDQIVSFGNSWRIVKEWE